MARHKEDNSPFEVVEDSDSLKGSRLVATRDLKPGEILLDEAPAFHGTLSAMSKGASHLCICISCSILLDPRNLKTCSQCGAPVCGTQCEKNPVHVDNECRLYKKSIMKLPLNGFGWRFEHCVLMIRAAGLMTKEPSVFEELLQLPTVKSEEILANRESLFHKVYNELKWLVMKFPRKFSDKLFAKIWSLYMFNGFLVTHTVPLGSSGSSTNNNVKQPQSNIVWKFVAVYSKASRINHSCLPNCTWAINPELGCRIRVRVSSPVKKGEELTISPTLNIHGNTYKRNLIYQRRFEKECECRRCKDPAELGLYSSGISCGSSSCRTNMKEGKEFGYYLPNDPIESDLTLYTCTICKDTMTKRKIDAILSKAETSINNIVQSQKAPLQNTNILVIQTVLDKLTSKCLHPNHGCVAKDIYTWVTFNFKPEDLDMDCLNSYIDLLQRMFYVKNFVGVSFERAVALNKLSDALKTKLQRSTLASSELVVVYVQFLEVSKEVFEYLMDEFCRPGEVFNSAGKEVFGSMKDIADKFKSAVPEGEMNSVKTFIDLLSKSNTATQLRKHLKNLNK